MFYHIIRAPPGYQGFMVMECRTRDPHSQIAKFRNQNGTLFFTTMEDARSVIPSDAIQLTLEADSPTFLELWKTPLPPA